MISVDGSQKLSLHQIRKALRDNPWIQSPLNLEVSSLLTELSLEKAYFERGAGFATRDLKISIEKHREWVRPVIDLDSFPYAYCTNGATEAINQWRMTDPRSWQFLKGDYLWPQHISKNGRECEIDSIHPDQVMYLSNPSASDGNFVNLRIIEKIKNIGCPVILDCAYVGASRKMKIDVWPEIEQVFFSFSKGWGLVGQRVGLLYSKYPHPTLEFMRQVECWNYQTPHIINKIIDNFTVSSMYERNESRQQKLCRLLNLEPSDSYFIGLSEDPLYRKQRRVGSLARLCLTPIWNLPTEDFD